MERFTISKSEKQTIYEIYRACRLCGAGGGYRMPIVQNIVDLESSDVELRQKIQECLQLEVRQDDRMPPLICELCVDKVNDFYEFFNLTRQTNVRTRTRLGLPLHTAERGETEPSDCILGVTEPVYVKDDEPSAKKAKAGPKCSKKIKKEPDAVKVKIENTSDSSRSSSVSSRSSRARGPSPPRAGAARPTSPSPRPARPTSPSPRPARPASPSPRPATPPPRRARAPAPAPAPAHNSRRSTGKPEQPKATQTTKDKKERKSEIQNLLDDNIKYDDNSLLVPRVLKRAREEPPRPALVPKRTKAPPPKEPVKEPTPPPPRSKPGPKSKKKPEPKAAEPKAPEKTPVPQKVPKAKAKTETPAKVKEAPKPPEDPTPKGPPFKCNICDAHLKTIQAHNSHLRCHTPSYTRLAHACNPCGKWFVTTEEAATHHRYHRAVTFPYHCRRCFEDYRTLQLYNDHITEGLCTQDEQPDVKCEDCWACFATETLRAAHRCPGEGGRPGGKCSNCSKTYATVKTLRKHESYCKQRRRELIADPDVLRRLKPMQVRIRRCDDLLVRGHADHYDVSNVKPNYGLAKNYVYPYLKFSPVKTEPLHRDSMVAIPVALKDEFATDYIHWDSDDSDTETIIRRVPTLCTLAIKRLFSKHCLGKVPKRRRRVKNEELENDEFAISSDINDIISSMGNDLGNGRLDRKDLTARIKYIIGCLDESDMDGGENVGANDNDDKNVDQMKDGNDAVCNGEFNESDDNKNESTKENLIQSNEDVSEEASSAKISSNVKICDKVIKDNDSNRIDEENENLNMPQSGTDNQSILTDDNKESDINLQKSIDNEEELVAESKESENVLANGITDTRNENSFENESRRDDCNEEKETEETSKQVNKASPIKHSIDNLIGDKNPDKYISEVISSIEDIINKNPRNEEDGTHDQVNGHTEINEIVNSNLMDVLEENIGENREKRISDNDKINTEINEKHNSNVMDVLEENVGENREKRISDNDKINTEINEMDNSHVMDVLEENIGENREKRISDNDKINTEINAIDNSNVMDVLEENIGEDREKRKSVNNIISTDLNEMDNSNVMDVLEENIGEDREKRISDNDKITLEDLLPKEDTRMELDDISDDDFNFDA